MVILLSQRAVDSFFNASFLLCEIRMILRETAPHHHLEGEQRIHLQDLLDSLGTEVQILRKELIP
ncbi:MAG: hypothetical protein LUP99_02060 [Methanomicrobiales archaeon]|nr:hypothetical protein [Methanomicrobiales archaeon]